MGLSKTIIFCSLLVLCVGSSLKKKQVIQIEPRDDVQPPIQPRDVIEISPPKPSDYKEIPFLRGAVPTCNGGAVDMTGTSSSNPVNVKSTNYPNNYPNNVDCSYKVSVPANAKLFISIGDFNIECPYDTVQFAFYNLAPLVNLCDFDVSNGRTFSVYESSSPYIFRVDFKSDFSIRYKGFLLNMYIESSGAPTTAAPATTTAAPATTTAAPATTTAAPTTTTAPPQTTTTQPPSGTCTCGTFGARSLVDFDRIVGGTTATAPIPYQIGLMSRGSTRPFCGGTLISRNWVLTAAHCTAGSVADNLQVSLGDLSFSSSSDGQTYINVAQIVDHPEYNSQNMNNDFSLLKLASPAPISSTVGIACLPSDVTQTFAGTQLTVSGWGTTSSGGSQSAVLKYATVNGLSNANCNSAYGSGTILDSMLCAGTTSFDTDSCQGDSGGPLVTNINGKTTVVGVVSWGYGCAQSPYPGVYARVTNQKSWILQNTDAGSCQN